MNVNRKGITVRYSSDVYDALSMCAKKNTNGNMAELLRKIADDYLLKEWTEKNSDDIVSQITNIIQATIQHEFRNLRSLIASGSIESASATLLCEKVLLYLVPKDQRQLVIDMLQESRRAAYERITAKKQLRSDMDSGSGD